MARFNAPQTSFFPFHITSRTPNRVIFPIPIKNVWEIFSEELYWAHRKYNFEIISFVLMPNHFHLLARTLEVPIGKILAELMRETSRRMNLEARRINQNWGETAFRAEVSDMNYYYNVYRYVYQNPVRSQLSETVQDYRYSTLNGLLGLSKLFIPVVEDAFLFEGDTSLNLKWLNELQDNESLTHIRNGLRYRKFRVARDRYKKLPLLLTDTPPLQK